MAANGSAQHTSPVDSTTLYINELVSPTSANHRVEHSLRSTLRSSIGHIQTRKLTIETGLRLISYVSLSTGYAAAHIISRRVHRLTVISLCMALLDILLMSTGITLLITQKMEAIARRNGQFTTTILLVELLTTIVHTYKLFVLSFVVFVWLTIYGNRMREASSITSNHLVNVYVTILLIIAAVIFFTRFRVNPINI